MGNNTWMGLLELRRCDSGFRKVNSVDSSQLADLSWFDNIFKRHDLNSVLTIETGIVSFFHELKGSHKI